MTGLYDRIKALCAVNGTDVASLERACGFKQGCIHKWNKSAPNVFKLRAVCKFFNITVEELLSGVTA